MQNHTGHSQKSHRAFPKQRIKSRVSRLLLQRLQIKVCERCFLCHSIVLCSTCKKCQKDTRNTVTTGLSGPAVHVSDRFTNSHRKTSSPRPTSHETHTVASQKQLESTRVTRKCDSNSQVPASPLTMVAKRRQCSHRSTITPNKTCFANIYRRIKRRVGCSLKRMHCKRVLVTSRKQTAYKLSGTKSSLSSFERVPRPLYRQDSTCGNQRHHSSVIHKQGRRHEVGPTLCSTMENLDLVYQETSNSQSPTHSRPAEHGSRQAIQTRPAHLDRVVSPPRGLPLNMQQVAPASNRPFYCVNTSYPMDNC